MKVMPPLIQKLGPHCLYKLFCFYFVVYWGNYRKAADYLNLSPSTLSKMIQALEGRLHCSLLRRKTQSPLRLTAEGAHVYAYSKQLVALFEDLEQSLGRVPQPKIYTVHLALPEWIWCDYFLEALQQFKVDHSECLLQLKTGRSADQCFINQDQIWISTNLHHRSEGIAKPLLELKTALYASPAYVQTNPPIQCVNDLKQHRGIYWQREDPRVLVVLNWHQPFTQNAFDPDLNPYSSVALLKMAEMGFGLISWFQDHPALKRSALVEIGGCLAEQSPCLQLYFHCSASLWIEPCIQSLYQRLKHHTACNGEKKS